MGVLPDGTPPLCAISAFSPIADCLDAAQSQAVGGGTCAWWERLLLP